MSSSVSYLDWAGAAEITDKRNRRGEGRVCVFLGADI